MLPTRRDLHFPLPANQMSSWHPQGAHVAHFFNTMSVFFPEGERFFINSVRHYRDRITDPELQKAVAGFIGQEAMHGREHADYNRKLAEAGLPVIEMEQFVIRLLAWFKKRTSPAKQLSATIALEHLTAILADSLLRDPRILEGADPVMADLWHWHALEETEHKAVAFDVYEQVMGRGLRSYLLRVSTLLLASTLFFVHLGRFHFRMMRAEGRATDWRGWWNLFRFQWFSPGALRQIVLPWLDYFRPSFHPWQHDNRSFLNRIPALEQRYALPAAA